ncbi:MAG: hypothetical protein ACRDNF_07505, partial [Streptosporangiaceae bacterium]
MRAAEITRAETAECARLLRVDSCDVALDLTHGAESFGSVSTIRFDCAEPGAASHVDLVAEAVHEITLNGKPLDPAGAWAYDLSSREAFFDVPQVRGGLEVLRLDGTPLRFRNGVDLRIPRRRMRGGRLSIEVLRDPDERGFGPAPFGFAGRPRYEIFPVVVRDPVRLARHCATPLGRPVSGITPNFAIIVYETSFN